MATPNEPKHKEQKKLLNRHCAGDMRQNGDSTREGTLSDYIGLSFVYLMCLGFCFFVYFFNVFSMHFVELSHASHVFIFESTHKF